MKNEWWKLDYYTKQYSMNAFVSGLTVCVIWIISIISISTSIVDEPILLNSILLIVRFLSSPHWYTLFVKIVQIDTYVPDDCCLFGI